MPTGPFFEQYQHIPRVRRLTEGLSSVQRAALLETTPLFTNGYPSSPFSYSRADVLNTVGRLQGDNDVLATLTMPLKAHPFCFCCGTTGGAGVIVLKTCAGCKTAQYCSVSCQKKDWALSNGGGRHKAICHALYEDLIAREVTPDIVGTFVAEGSLDDTKGRFYTEEAQRFNEKFGVWREFGRQLIHQISAACLEKASKFNINPVTVLELTSTRFLLEEVPRRAHNENMFRIIYIDQVSSDIFVTRTRIRYGPRNEQIDIFQHELACNAQIPLTSSDDVLEAQAPGIGLHAVQFFFAGKPLTHSSIVRCDINNILNPSLCPSSGPILPVHKLVGICNRGTMMLIETLLNLLAIRDHSL